MKGVLIKLPNNTWICVKGKMGSVVSRGGKKRSVYTLVGESIEDFRKTSGKPARSFYVASTSVTKYVYRLIDSELAEKASIVIEYVNPEVYRVEVYGDAGDEAYRIAEEMGILRKQKQESSESS